MSQLIKLFLLTILWAVVLNKLFQLWRAPDDRPLRYATAGLLGAALAFTVGQEPLESSLDTLLTGLPRLLLNIASACGFYGLLGFFVYSLHNETEARSRMHRHLTVLGTLLGIALIAWISTPLPVREQPATPTASGTPSATIFLLAIVAAWIYAQTHSLRYAMHSARRATRPRLRRGMVILTIGLTGLMVSSATTVSLVGAAWTTPPNSPIWTWLRGTYLTTMLLGPTCLAIGLAYPVLASMRDTVPRWSQHHRENRALKPLWRTMNHAFPSLEMGRTYRPWNVHRLRYRRAIEIRDALVQLGPYYPRTTPKTIQEQAQHITQALNTHRTATPEHHPPHPIPAPHHPTLDAEVHWLVQLAQAMLNNPTTSTPHQ